MSTMTSDISSVSIAAAAEELRRQMSGRLVLPTDSAYTEGCRLWNRRVRRRPAMIALCQTASDVEAAVQVARRHLLPLSVRGGGHDWAGRALCDDGIVIDLTNLCDVAIDPRRRIATVAGGAKSKDLAAAAEAHNLIAALGNCGTVGVAGLTLGGGYGPFAGTYGLAIDNLLSADIVLATGKRVRVTPDDMPEVFWALRGGGGNFGVVTSMQIRLHERRCLLGSQIMCSGDQAKPALRAFDRFAANMPEQMGATVAVMVGADGEPAVQFSVLWHGDQLVGQAVLNDLQKALGAEAAIHRTTYTETLAFCDAWLDELKAFSWACRTVWLPELTAEAVDIVVDAVANKGAPFAFVNWHYQHGAATRVAPEATAFGQRRRHFMGEILAAWQGVAGQEDDEGEQASWRWANGVAERLMPFSLPGGYANLLGPDHEDQARKAYGGNHCRLLTIKQKFDPAGLFASAIPLVADDTG
jgi:hypothetical protein